MDWRIDEQSKRKYRAAEHLGLIPRLRESGWAGLSAKESGQIGARMRHGKPRGAAQAGQQE